jgi:hypothetical protein
VLVKGYLATTRGKFKITVGCNGVGCEPPPPPPAVDCLFGARWADLAGNPAVVVNGTNAITAATLATLAAADQQRLLEAVRQAPNLGGVATPLDALNGADGDTVTVTWLSEPAARRSFIAFDFVAGGESYGAVFHRHTGARVATIQDGDLASCAVVTETCRLPEDYGALKNDPAAFILQEERVITDASQLEGVEVDQVLDALRRSFGGVGSVDAGLAMADDDRVSYRVYTHNGTNTDLVGDTSVGAIYYYRSLQLAGVIDDLFIDGCSLFAPKGGVALSGACRGAGDCVSGLLCAGVFAGAGACVSTAGVPGEDLPCDGDAACGSAALVCAGAPLDGGICTAAWMRGTFEDAATTALPDAATHSSRLVVRGLASVDTDVIVTATIQHPAAGQLRVTLLNPRGTERVLHDGVPSDDGQPLVIDEVVGFAETVNGEWTLRIQDRTTGQTGTLAGWHLTATSRWD